MIFSLGQTRLNLAAKAQALTSQVTAKFSEDGGVHDEVQVQSYLKYLFHYQERTVVSSYVEMA